jgi:hypothetical protein
VLDRVAAATAHADDFDLGAQVEFFDHFNAHVFSPMFAVAVY